MVVVDIAAALICFGGSCFPALIGADTPRGTYQIVYQLTEHKGYGGDILQYKETDTNVYAIHRVWTLNPKENRLKRLASKNPADRRITKGCINVSEEVYNELLDCCYNDTLEIK